MDPANSAIPTATQSQTTPVTPTGELVSGKTSISNTLPQTPDQLPSSSSSASTDATTPPAAFYSTPSLQQVQEMQPVARIHEIPLLENALKKEVNLFAHDQFADQPPILRQHRQNTLTSTIDPLQQPALVLPTIAPNQTSPDLTQVYSQVQNHNTQRLFTALNLFLIVALLGLGIQSLLRAMIFVFVDFPALEEAFYGHQYGETSLNQFAIGSGMLIITSALSFFFALQFVQHFREWRGYLFGIFGILLIAAGILAVVVTPSLSFQTYL